MDITHLNDPFPYVIIDDFYDSQALDKVWREAEYVNNPNRMTLADKSNTYTPTVDGVQELSLIHI